MTNLATLLTDNVNGTTFISIDTTTSVHLTGGKKNPQKGRVSKRSVGHSVMVFQNKSGSSYGNMVKRRLEKEGKNPESFVLGPRQWGKRLTGGPFVEHKGQYYIEVIFLKKGKSEYLLDGEVIDKEDIQGLPPYDGESNQGGLDDKVIVRSYKASSIDAIRINKKTYTNLTFNLPH